MMGIELNAQVMIKNLHWQNMHEKSPPPTGARRRTRMELEYQDWARLQGRGPHTGGRSDRLVGLVGLRMWWSQRTSAQGQTPVDST
jgi:hypothetical protein